MSPIEPWVKEEKELLGKHRIFDVYRQRKYSPKLNKSGDFYVLECPDWINVIALTPDKQVVLVEQYRQGADCVSLEVPGGAIDPGEDPATAALRELREETGFTSKKVECLGKVLANPAIQNNFVHFYLASEAEKTDEMQLDPMEEIEVSMHPFSKISSLIAHSKILHSYTVSAFFYLSLYFQRKSSG